MGSCNSCEASVAVAATAKIILPDGRLEEHPAPVRVSDIPMGKSEERGRLFLCNADHMQFDGYISAMGSEEELQPGQIYFALPRSMLRRRLSPDDMAALAVRASTALVKNKCNVAMLDSWDAATGPEMMTTGSGAAVAGPTPEEGRRRRKMSRGKSFSSDLISIPESE